MIRARKVATNLVLSISVCLNYFQVLVLFILSLNTENIYAFSNYFVPPTDLTFNYNTPLYLAVNGFTTIHTSEYIEKLCDKNSTMYSESDCRKLTADEQKLFRKLMRNYEKAVRPVYNSSTTVTIKLGLTLAQIFDMEEKNQILITNVWLDIEWQDEFLTWDPEKFSGLKVLRIPCKKIWLPDLVLYNNAADFADSLMDANAMVHYDGKVFWPVPTKLKSTCKIDVSYFPFDIQVCKLKFGSWTYDGFQVDITNRTEDIDLNNYVQNGEWDLIKTSVVRNVVYYPCCPEPFPDVTFTLKIRRKILFYLYNVIFPCLMLSALTLLTFVIPPDSGEKVALGITVLLSFSVFMLAVAENMPETSEHVPLISIYLTLVMAMTSVSVTFTVFVLNLHHRGPQRRRVPRWLRKLLVNDFSEKNVKYLNKALIRTKTPKELATKQNAANMSWFMRIIHSLFHSQQQNEAAAAAAAATTITTTTTTTTTKQQSPTNTRSSNSNNINVNYTPKLENSNEIFSNKTANNIAVSMSLVSADEEEEAEGLPHISQSKQHQQQSFVENEIDETKKAKTTTKAVRDKSITNTTPRRIIIETAATTSSSGNRQHQHHHRHHKHHRDRSKTTNANNNEDKLMVNRLASFPMIKSSNELSYYDMCPCLMDDEVKCRYEDTVDQYYFDSGRGSNARENSKELLNNLESFLLFKEKERLLEEALNRNRELEKRLKHFNKCGAMTTTESVILSDGNNNLLNLNSPPLLTKNNNNVIIATDLTPQKRNNKKFYNQYLIDQLSNSESSRKIRGGGSGRELDLETVVPIVMNPSGRPDYIYQDDNLASTRASAHGYRYKTAAAATDEEEDEETELDDTYTDNTIRSKSRSSREREAAAFSFSNKNNMQSSQKSQPQKSNSQQPKKPQHLKSPPKSKTTCNKQQSHQAGGGGGGEELNSMYTMFNDAVMDSFKRSHLEDVERKIIYEWRIVASFIDKILFWLFFLLTIALTFICLIILPNTNKLRE